MKDSTATWVEQDWQRLLGFSEMPSSTSAEVRSSKDSTSVSTCMTVVDSSEPVCTCFKGLTEHLHQLNVTERQQSVICLDMTFARTDTVLHFAQVVLSCHFCRLDSKVLLLVMTIVQTVLNWVKVVTGGKGPSRDLPPIHFGEWKVPETDGHLIKEVLTSRILTSSINVVKTLCLKMRDFADEAGKQGLSYQVMDSESLEQMLRRLRKSLQDLADSVQYSFENGPQGDSLDGIEDGDVDAEVSQRAF